MKKIFLILISLSIFSCQDELDSFNENPNSPTSVTPGLLLAATEASTFSIQTTGLSRLANIWTQHLCGSSLGQYGEYTVYNIYENSVENEWNSIYTDSGVNAYDIVNKYGADNPYYSGIAKVLMALNVSFATDFWGDVPFDDAFKGVDGVTSPTYQTQEDVYLGMQTMLSDAITDLGQSESSNAYIPSTDDLIFGGDIEKWIKVANTLRARLAMRLTEVEGGSTAAQKALEYLNSGALTSVSDDMNAVFSGSGGSINQWYAFQNERADYIKMGDFFINMLEGDSDPRLPFYAAQDASGGYSGTSFSNTSDITTSNIGSFLATADKSVGIITYVETKFIEAEAKFRTGDLEGATTAFQEAVGTSVEQVTGEANPTFVAEATSSVDLNTILTQKYIALFGMMEPYNDYRRTGIPALSPASGSDVAKRLPTPANERLYNSNAVVVSNTTESLWWDAN